MNNQSNPFQSVGNLGALKSMHGFSRYFRNNRFFVSGFALAGMFTCLCLTLYAVADEAQRAGDAPAGRFNPFVVVGFAGFFILLWGFAIFWLLRDWLKNRNYAAALFEGGVAILEHNGEIQSLSWQEIKDIQAIRLKQGGFRNYDVVGKDGRVLVLPHYLEGLSDLVKAIEQRIVS